MAFFPRIFEHIKKSFVIRFREALTSLVFIGILRELMCCIEAKAARGLLAHVAAKLVNWATFLNFSYKHEMVTEENTRVLGNESKKINQIKSFFMTLSSLKKQVTEFVINASLANCQI